MEFDWDYRRVQEALIILQATNRDKWPLERDATDEPAELAPDNILLDHAREFWMAMVVNGRLDTGRLQANGYTPEQQPWLESEMKRMGWL